MKSTDLEFVRDFTRDIPRGLSSRYLSEQAVPQARWQAPDVILDRRALAYDPENPGGKILIGAFGDKLIGIEDNRHVLTVAGNRAGKSVTIVANLLFYRGSVLAMDPKAELANITAERRAALGQKVIVLDPFNHANKRLARFRKRYNPLAVLTLDNPTIIEDAGLIADALVVTTPNSKDPHWDESGKNFIEGLELQVATDPIYEGRRNLLTVRELIKRALSKIPAGPGDDDDEPRFVVKEQMLENAARLQGNSSTAHIGAAIEGAALDFYEKSDRERSAVLSTVRRHTKLLDYAAMKNVLSGSDFDLADLKRDPKGVTV